MPRAGLTRTRVVDEAGFLADELGLDHFTLAALAERLGVRQPSLYKHIESMGGLQRDISVAAKGALAYVLAKAAIGRAGGHAIASIARAYRSWAKEHPGLYAASQRPPAAGDAENEAISRAAVQVIADVLAANGLSGDDAVHVIRALRASLHGFVVLETAGAFALDADVNDSFDIMLDGFVRSFGGTLST